MSSTEDQTETEHEPALAVAAASADAHPPAKSDKDLSTKEKEPQQGQGSSSRRRSIAIVCIGAVILALVLGLSLGLTLGRKEEDDNGTPSSSSSSTTTNSSTAPVADAGVTPAPWPHEVSDIPLDPNVRVGNLPNGLRYMILPHSEPPNKVSLRLHVDAGSLMEDDDQQGLAHFLEHMLFNGLRNFKPEELIPRMQRLGIAFGSHANAYTSFDETAYQLDLPNTDVDTLDLCFTVMRDYADGALLLEEEIEKERGVVISEMNARESVSFRLLRQQFQFFLPDHLLTHRFPIGVTEVLETAPRERFADFYSEYYTPMRMTFIVSGDVDADAMEARIIESFENMTNPDDPGTDPDLGSLPVDTGFRAAVFADPEVTSDDLSIMAVRPYESKPDTESNRMEDMGLYLANRILGERFQVLAKQENSSITGGGSYQSNWFNEVEFGSFWVGPVDGRLEDAVAVLEQEFRRAIEFGFTLSELDWIKAVVLNSYEQRVESAATRESNSLSNQLVNTINSNTVFSSPEENLRIAEMALALMTPERVHEDFREFWDTPDLNLVYVTNGAPEDVTEVLETLYTQSQAVVVDPPVDKGSVTFAYTDFGSPGTIVSDKTMEDLDIRQIVLSNNVRVNMKKTDFEENSVIITASFGTGMLGQPKSATWLDSFASTVMNAGGLGNHSLDELKRITAGKSVGVGFSVGSDSFSFSGSTTPDDLELELQLLAAYLSDPGYREEAVRRFRQQVPATLSSLKHTLSGAFTQMDEWLHGGDGRFAVPTEAGLLGFEASDAKDWIQPQLTDSYLEVSIVGELPDTTLTYVLETLGALPTRANSTDTTNVDREIEFPESPQNKTFTYESTLLQAAAAVVWEIPPLTASGINETRALTVLSRVFGDRMREKIREELGASYGPRAFSSPSSSFNYGQFTAYSVTDPEDATSVGLLILDIARQLSEDGITEDELVRSLEPTFVFLEDTLRENTYWLSSVMDESQAKPYQLDWSRNRDEFYASIKVEDVNELATKFLLPENAVRLELLPVDLGEGEGNNDSTASDTPSTRSRLLRGVNGGIWL